MEKQPNGGEHQNQQPGREADRRPNQRFYFGPWVFEIDKAQARIAEQPRDVRNLVVEAWARFYGLDDNRDDRHSVSLIGPGPEFNRRYAMTTDLTEPVIVAMLRSEETGEESPLLIDGTHRLFRAYQEGIAALPAYVLSVEESLAIRQERYYR
jgi:hypothetical protein